MRTTRIEFEGTAGRGTIERAANSPTMRIDSYLRDPQPGSQTWKTWNLSAHAGEEEMLEVARELQRRTDGVRGTNGDVCEYLRELQRFAG